MDGLYKDPSGYENPEPIESVLRRQASQENCDGEPYDAMIYAARYIDYLKRELQSEVEQCDFWEISYIDANKHEKELIKQKNDLIKVIAKLDDVILGLRRGPTNDR